MVDRDDRLAERVDLIDPPELLEALDRSPQVGPDAIGLGLRIESEAAVTLVGILVIPLREQLVGPFTVAGPVGAAAHGDTDGQHRAEHQSDDDQPENVHGSLARLEPPPAIPEATKKGSLQYNDPEALS